MSEQIQTTEVTQPVATETTTQTTATATPTRRSKLRGDTEKHQRQVYSPNSRTTPSQQRNRRWQAVCV